MFLTPEQTGGPRIFALRRHNYYLAIRKWPGYEVREFNIDQLAQVLDRPAGATWQEHASLILLACMDGRLFEWLDKIGGEQC